MEATSTPRNRFVCRTCGQPAVTVHHPAGPVTLHESPDSVSHEVDGPIRPRPEAHPLTPGYGTSRPATPLDSDSRMADHAAETDARRYFDV